MTPDPRSRKSGLGDDFRHEPPYPPDYLFPQAEWSGLGDLGDLRGLERRLRQERLIPLSYVRLRERLGFALLTMDMQNRWRNEYSNAQRLNAEAVKCIRDLAAALPDHRMILVGGLDALCTLYPDPAVRPLDVLDLLVCDRSAVDAITAQAAERGYAKEDAANGDPMRHVFRSKLATLPPLVVYEGSMHGWTAADLMPSARPACETPAPSHGGMTITRDAPRLTSDATKSAQEASRGIMPSRPSIDRLPRPKSPSADLGLEDAAESGGDRPRAALIDGVPNLLLPCREDALALAMLMWAQRPAASREGLYAWELSEMTRRWTLDWGSLGRRARERATHALLFAVFSDILQVWRADVPQSGMDATRPGPVARWLISALPATRAQKLLQHPLLRRL